MKNEAWGQALRVLGNLSGWIAFPVLIGVILGKWLDRKFNTEPWLFLTTIGACFLVSMYGLIINALKEFKKIEQLEKKTKSIPLSNQLLDTKEDLEKDKD